MLGGAMLKQRDQRHDGVELCIGITVADDREQQGHDFVAGIGHAARCRCVRTGHLRAARHERDALAQHGGVGLEAISEILAGGRRHQRWILIDTCAFRGPCGGAPA